MFDNLKALLKLMDIDMTRGVKATLYVTSLDYLEVALKVCVEAFIENILTYLLKVWLEEFKENILTYMYVYILTYSNILKVWLEERNWKEYPALTTVQVGWNMVP